MTYHTHWYSINAEFVAENGIIYTLMGDNILLCVDSDTEELVELSESELTALEDVLSEQGYRIEKVLENGQILIRRAEATYDLQGRKMHAK